MNRRVVQWVDDGGGRWVFWTAVCLALGVWNLTFSHWYDYLIGSLLVVEAGAWAFWWGPRSVKSRRRLREHITEAQTRFYWTMGSMGVPIDVVREADRLLAEGSAEQASSVLTEWV